MWAIGCMAFRLFMKRDSVDYEHNWKIKLEEKLVADHERNEANILHNLIIS
jgi:hypothetical protein